MFRTGLLWLIPAAVSAAMCMIETVAEDQAQCLCVLQATHGNGKADSEGVDRGFGPVVKRVFSFEISREGTFVDLESNTAIQVPEDVKKDRSGKRLIAWAKEKKIDINVRVRPGPICYLSSLDSCCYRSNDTSCNGLLPTTC